MLATEQQVFDVVIMGAGFAGNCQTRHLLLKMPNLKIALIDPRPIERSTKDQKVGESLVEITSIFLSRELGLHDYLLENHVPKYGLSFHWPKDLAKTETTEDYYNIWVNRTPSIDSFQLNRAKLERDLLKMNQKMGTTVINGRVTEFELAPDDNVHTIQVKVGDSKIELKAKHLIDAAGRRFLIGKKVDNLTFDPQELSGIDTGSVWLHVRNVNTTIFDDRHDFNTRGASRLYTTNHWFGHGHWLWMFPSDVEDKEMSIGLIYHKNVISSQEINSLDKLKAFLKANHHVLYDLIESGELVDFHHLPRLAHMSKELISPDNWYVLGDAGYMIDPFYSPGLVLTSMAIETVTETIRAKLAGDADADEKQQLYNQFLTQYQKRYAVLYQRHDKHIGNASIMSWRIYLENMFWFGIIVPMYVGKWFLDFRFLKPFIERADFVFFNKNGLFNDFYNQLDRAMEKGKNIGLMDYDRGDQLLWGHSASKLFDNFLANAKYEPLRCNVFAGIKSTYFFTALFYLKFRFKAFGLLGVLAPASVWRVMQILWLSFNSAIGERVYLHKTRNLPSNSAVNKTRDDFKKYRHQPILNAWREVPET
ncbi:tryptophan halogenase [Leptolyngbyaceae cyanobacterium CCMR0082]|uniref:Tryptophan halogenase n=1 Tax=Adonisia turfae CCMR0082 TaxID=2304604 RepID=A0A6M0S5E6_9CYAN|nr:tryptophan 7-halogenase [Adonisia turfae]NEZ63616.1 tryptophan halogenase [Adonisia turfae CCMR0082]